MKVYELRFRLPQPRPEVHAFVSNVRHLDLMTPSWLRFEILSDVRELRPGSTIDYRMRWRGLPLRWRSCITEWSPEVFTYEQVCGPYRRWIHEHIFEKQGGGTLVIDRVHWAVGGGWLIDPLVERDIRRISITVRECFGGRSGLPGQSGDLATCGAASKRT